MSFLKMSAVGHLPPDQKLKRGEVLLQYTKVLAQPDYTPIPFHKQQVKTIKCDLTWTFTKLMKKIHKHDGCKPPIHVRELLWEVEQEVKRKKAELEEAKRIFKDRFTGVKGLTRFGHEVKKPTDDDEIDSEEHSDASRGAQSDYTTDHTDNEDDDAPPPPPSPPLMPAPALASAQQEEEEAEPGGSPEVVEHAAEEEEQQEEQGEQPVEEQASEEQAAEEQLADEQPVAEQPVEEPPQDEQPNEQQEQQPAEELPEEDQPVAEEAAAPAEEAAAVEQSEGFESPTDDPERLAPGHQVLAAVTGSTSRPPAHPGARSAATEEVGSTDAAEHGGVGRRRSWVETANDGQHALAAAMMGRRASLERRSSGSQQQQPAAVAQTGEASVQHSRQASGVPAIAASSSRPVSAVHHTELPISQPLQSSSSRSALHAARSRPLSAVNPAEDDGTAAQAGSRPISAVRPAASSRPISAVEATASSSRPISAVQAASSSRPISAVKQSSRPDSAVASEQRVLGSRPTSAVVEEQRVLGSRPTSAVLGSRPTSAVPATGSKPASVHGSRPTTAQRTTPLSQQRVVAEEQEETKEQPTSTTAEEDEKKSMFASGTIQSGEHLLGADTGYDFDEIRAAQAANPDGGFLHAKEEAISDEPDARAILKGNVNVDDADDDEPGPSVEDDVVREGPRPYGFLPFLKISRNGFTKEVRIPGFGDKVSGRGTRGVADEKACAEVLMFLLSSHFVRLQYIDPPIGWLREKFRFAAPAGVHAFVTLHAYGYTVYAKNNIRF